MLLHDFIYEKVYDSLKPIGTQTLYLLESSKIHESVAASRLLIMNAKLSLSQKFLDGLWICLPPFEDGQYHFV